MSLTISVPMPRANSVPGVYSSEVEKYALLVGDSAYPIGGYPVTPGGFGFSMQIQSVTALAKSVIPQGWQTIYDAAYGTIRFLQVPATPTGGMNEAATGTNLSGVQLEVQALGW